MSITTGLIHPGDKFLNVEPKRTLTFSNVVNIFPNQTNTIGEAYTAGEVVWGFGRTSVAVWKQNVSAGFVFTQRLDLPPTHPDNIAAAPYTIISVSKAVSVLNPLYTSSWNRLTLASTVSAPYNTAQLTTSGVGGNDWGAVVYNTPIPNNWVNLNISARTSIHGAGSRLWFGLITDPAVINSTATNIANTSGIFNIVNASANTRMFEKVVSGVVTPLGSTSATSNKTGVLNNSSVTFQRETPTSENIRVFGSLNGVAYTSHTTTPYALNVLPITGESYIAVGATTGADTATMTVGEITYHTTTA